VAGAARGAAGGEREAVGARAADHHPAARRASRARLPGQLCGGPALRDRLADQARERGGSRVRAVELRAGRGLPVRLEPRDRGDERRDDDREGRAHAPVPQPDVPGARLSAGGPGDGVRRARTRLCVLQGRLHARSTTT
jgi:hypothetical protein